MSRYISDGESVMVRQLKGTVASEQ